ncbi:hypothetical protein DH2020_011567 [Rehmannia glutinosa]|uniref:Tubby-like F-box protein n=1 Tax=Rehmannia glutinosa TaxID=99300 RepID=A0ABR0XDU4_REHGL
MSLRRSFLPRRIIHRSFALSKSCQKSESLDLASVCNSYSIGGEEKKEENDDDGYGCGSGQLPRPPQRHDDVVLSGESGPCESGSWAGMLPELLGEIMQRVEASEEQWPQRQNVVACGCVCKRWREATREAVEKASLHQPGKITSDFLGTNFTIYDSQPPHSGAKPSNSKAGRRFASKQISPQVPATNFEIGHVSYKFNLLKSRGPRRMVCTLTCPSSDKIPSENYQDNSKTKRPEASAPGYTVLKNKAPRWHEHLECWCLNFHGRVTVASVKNFQMVATIDPSKPGGKGDEETVLLQFGKVADDTFTMDYREPLSAFQAFAICLTSFGTKLACE